MLFHTFDNTFKHIEIIALTETLRFNVVMNRNEYENNIHKQKDTNIEDWLAGKLVMFQNEKELEGYNRQLEKEEIKKRGYVT